MTRDLVTQIKQYLSGHRRRNRLTAVLCVLSLVTAFGVSAVMTMPAISLEQAEPLLETDASSAVQGAEITVHITAAAQPKQDQTYFLLSSRNWNAGLVEAYEFTGDMAEITADDGARLELHRIPGEDGDQDYWFCLEQGRTVSFDLHCAAQEGTEPAAPADEEATEPEDLTPSEESGAPEPDEDAETPDEAEAPEGEPAAPTDEEAAEPEDLAPSEESSAPEPDEDAETPDEAEAPEGEPAAPTDEEAAEPEDLTPSGESGAPEPDEESAQDGEEPSRDTSPEAVASMTITAGGGGTLEEAAAAVAQRKSDAEYRPLILTWLPEEPLFEQTLTATLYTDETGEEPLAEETALITVSGALPRGASVRAHPVPVQMEDAAVLGAYDITIYRLDGTAFEPREGLPLTVEIRLPQMTASGESPEDYAVYYVPESGGPEGVEAITADGGVRFTASHFSTYAVVGPTALAETDRMDLQVVKEWSDGNGNHSGDSVEVHLYADGADTGRSLTLGADNEWSGSFENLPLEDGNGNGIDYSVQEEAVAGYLARYHIETIPGGDTWEETDTLEAGGVYRFVAPNGRALAYSGSGGSLEAARDDGTDELQQWTATAVNGGFRLTNVSARNRWLRYNNGFTTSTNSTSNSAFTLSDNRLKCSNDRYVTVDGSIGSTRSFDDATRFTVYRKGDPRPDGQKVTIINRKIETPVDDFKLQHHKTIDYLGGGGQNPDTTLAGDDLYRIYLDISGRQQPVDLLVVVDQSNSMQTNWDMENAAGEEINRITAVNDLLSGSGGFIQTFLGLNEQNQIAISTFGGKFYKNGVDGDRFTDTTARSGYTYETDSEYYRAWGRDLSDTALAARADGTNYEAGLLRAEEVFSAPEVQDNGHKKIMVFLSDGDPTYYIDSNGDRQGDGANTTNTVTAQTKLAVDTFCAGNSGVTIYSIGFGSGLDAGVLEYMAEQGGGAYYAASNFSKLEDALAQVIQQSKNADVTISDSMSRYVQWYGKQPDVKVTMKDTDGVVKVLYENGAVTADGEGILEGVAYTAAQSGESTGTVTAKFCEDYFLNAAYVYTLSFNVEVTEAAYQEYSASGYPDVGAPGTDYGSNTSAEREGFRSNLSAEVSYVVDGSAYSEPYDHPVVQVVAEELRIVKRGETGSGPLLPGAEFALYPAELADGEWVKTGDAIREGATDTDGALTFTGLLPGRYLLYETKAPDGYKAPKEPWRVEVTGRGAAIVGLELSNGAYILINAVSYILPSTGGHGAATVSFAGLFLAAGSYLLLLKKRHSERLARGN